MTYMLSSFNYKWAGYFWLKGSCSKTEGVITLWDPIAECWSYLMDAIREALEVHKEANYMGITIKLSHKMPNGTLITGDYKFTGYEIAHHWE